jgi:hypothetical protein
MAVRLHTLEEIEYADSERGEEYSTGGVVTNVTGASDVRAKEAALAYYAAGGTKKGDLLTLPGGTIVRCYEVRVSVEAPDIFRVRSMLRQSEQPDGSAGSAAPILEGTVALSQVETNVDKDGNPITVSFGGVVQGGLVTVDVPLEAIRVSMTRTSPPTDTQKALVGKLNSGGWPGDPSAAARTWKLDELRYTTEDLGQSWQWDAVWSKRADGHDPLVAWIDPETGRPPDGLVVDVGYKRPPIASTGDFSAIFV